jgi:hypothetical protein
MARHCSECHGEQKQKSGFRLDSQAILLRGGESGQPAIVPGHNADSPLILRVACVKGATHGIRDRASGPFGLDAFARQLREMILRPQA